MLKSLTTWLPSGYILFMFLSERLAISPPYNLLVFSKKMLSLLLGRYPILGSSKRNEDSHMTMTIKVNYQKTFQEVVEADKLATK